MAPKLRFLALALALGFQAPHFETVAASPIDNERQQQQQQQQVIGIGSDPGSSASIEVGEQSRRQRKLNGKFLHITDFHPDEFYKVHTSTASGIACHRGKGPSGYYGAETTDCDSPLSLVNATFDWISENLADDIDFVVWTGDTARHDGDENIPRNQNQVIGTNRFVADKFFELFRDPDNKHRMNVPVVPNFGNNDILPHNILNPGPTKWLHYYTDIWRHFIPEEQRHSFEYGGWFNVEVVPGHLSVFSLNTLYLFDRNAAVDGCASPDEPGFKQMEWLRVQLQLLRERGMKAILIGHVPPARTDSKRNWDETCWQKYNLWMRQYRDVVITSLYGHMNIDHFIAHDTHDIDLDFLGVADAGALDDVSERQPLDDDLSIASASDYLKELREGWSQLPDPRIKALDEGEEDSEAEEWDDLLAELYDDNDEVEGSDVEAQKKKHKKKKKKKKKKKGKGKKSKKIGKFAERYHVSLISPSIVPNYFPTLRVFEYNISGIEDSAIWTDSFDPESHVEPAMEDADHEEYDEEPVREELKRDMGFETEGKKGKKKKGKKGKKHKNPNFVVPKAPSKSDLPGPAYSPQSLSLLGYTQYYANLTYINNDMTHESKAVTHNADEAPRSFAETVGEWLADAVSPLRWRDGIHKDKKPKHDKPQPKPFEFTVEYSTFTDKIFKLSDLTVRSYVKLAYRIGQDKLGKKALPKGVDDDDRSSEGEDGQSLTSESEVDTEVELENGGDEEEEEEGDEDEDLSEGDEAETEGKKHKGKKGKKKKKKKKKKGNNKVWMHFLRHAFVETVPKKKLKKY